MMLRVAVSLLVARPGMCAVKMPNTFSDHMVLPAEPDNSYIHGLADPGEQITVDLTGEVTDTYKLKANADGSFKVRMRHGASTGSSQISVSGATGATVMAADVRWGDVVVCSGQSNMEFPVREAAKAEEIKAAVGNYSDIIRIFKNPRKKSQKNLFEAECDPDFDTHQCKNPIGWAIPSVASIDTFSAVCYLYATSLIEQTGRKTPIGLIESAVGNTDIKTWSPASSIFALNGASLECKEPTSIEDASGYGVLFYGMISPHRFNPVTTWLWYQGEHNSHRDVNTPANDYECWFRAMIWTWRHYFAESAQKPFLYVQLSDAETYKALGAIRDAQQRLNFDSPEGVPGVGMAVTMDIGTKGTVHPTNKTEVGRRLALTARSLVFNETDVSFRGPQVEKFEQSGRELRVTMKHADGLRWDDTHDCSTCCDAAGRRFEVTTGIFGESVNVTMSLDSDGALVGILPDGFEAQHIRYGFDLFAQCVLRNSKLLPAGAFMHPAYRYPLPLPVGGQAPRPDNVKIGGNPTSLKMSFADVSGSLSWSHDCRSKSLQVTDGLFGASVLLPVDVDVKNRLTANMDKVPFAVYGLRYRASDTCYLADDTGTRVADFDAFAPKLPGDLPKGTLVTYPIVV